MGRGRDIGGYQPLWADTATIKVDGKIVRHYRRGGVPLYDTGELFRSLSSKQRRTAGGVRLTLLGSLIALWQHMGFVSRAPNWIPFTRAGVRATRKRKRKKPFGWGRGGSYTSSDPPGLVLDRMVTIPPRPIFAMPASALQGVARAVARALGSK